MYSLRLIMLHAHSLGLVVHYTPCYRNVLTTRGAVQLETHGPTEDLSCLSGIFQSAVKSYFFAILAVTQQTAVFFADTHYTYIHTYGTYRTQTLNPSLRMHRVINHCGMKMVTMLMMTCFLKSTEWEILLTTVR